MLGEMQLVETGNPYRRGQISTVDLLVLTSFDKLLYILKILFSYFTKQVTPIRRSTVLSLPLQLVFPGGTHSLYMLSPFVYVKHPTIGKIIKFKKSLFDELKVQILALIRNNMLKLQ